MNRLTETEKAWLAGFIDGEGCISARETPSRVGHTRRPTFTTYLIVANTYRPVIEQILELTGVGSIQVKTDRANPLWKPSFKWVTSSRNARAVLEQVQPYLRVKHAQARIVLESPIRCGIGSVEIHGAWERQADAKWALNILNRKGRLAA